MCRGLGGVSVGDSRFGVIDFGVWQHKRACCPRRRFDVCSAEGVPRARVRSRCCDVSRGSGGFKRVVFVEPCACSGDSFTATVLFNGNRKYPHHYQCADALGLLGALKAAGAVEGAQQAAERIAAAAPASALINKLEVVRSGFINIYLDNRCDESCFETVTSPMRGRGRGF